MDDRLNLLRDATEVYCYLHGYLYNQNENNDHCLFEFKSQIVMLVMWDLNGEKTEMVVKSVCNEGKVLEKYLFAIKACFIKNQRPLFFFSVYFIIYLLLFDISFRN